VTQTIDVQQIPVPDFIRSPVPKGMLIGGEWTQAQTGETFETVNPATGSVLATVASGGPDDVDRAVAAARRAFEEPAWADMNPHERTLVLLRIADAIEANRDELATLESLDGGIPIMVDFGYFLPERPYWQLVTERLRPGDISTHMFRGPVPYVDKDGKLYDYLKRARARGRTRMPRCACGCSC